MTVLVNELVLYSGWLAKYLAVDSMGQRNTQYPMGDYGGV